MVDSTPLLSQAFVDRLCRLTWSLARRRAEAGDRGLDVRRPGGRLDFQGHRAYSPGDDPRWIDWNALGRIDQVVVKVFTREEEQTVDLLVDVTRSMHTGRPDKLDAARRLAAALAFLALHSRHRVRVGRLGGTPAPLHGLFQGLEAAPALFSVLEGLEPAATGDIEQGLRNFLGRVRRPGAVVVLSDGLDEEALAAGLAHLGNVAGETTFFQVLSPEELQPDLHGVYRLCDCESGAQLDVEVDAAVRQRYRQELGQLRESYRELCARHHIRYQLLKSDASLETTVIAWHRAGGGR